MSKNEPSTMSAEEKLQREKAEIWSPDYVPPLLLKRKDRGKAILAKLPTIVAEGDSWFDYAPGKDVLDNLRGEYGYSIHKFAEAGDTLENMVYGTKIRPNFSREPAGIVDVVAAVKKYQPEAVLLSAGGNDIAGAELMTFLNHASSSESAGGTKWLRADEWKLSLRHSEATIRAFAQAVWKENPKATVLMHGYARPVPDGRAVINFPFGFRFVGPWLRPSFAKKGYTDWKSTEPWIGRVLDNYNDMIAGIAASFGKKFRYVDVRSAVGRNDWANELHPTNPGFARVAARIHAVLKTI